MGFNIDELIKLGIGSAFLAKEKLQEFIEEAKKRGELSQQEAQQLINDLKKDSEEKLEELKKMIEKEVKKQLKELGVATKDDVDKLLQKIEELENLLKNK